MKMTLMFFKILNHILHQSLQSSVASGYTNDLWINASCVKLACGTTLVPQNASSYDHNATATGHEADKTLITS